MIHHYRAFGMGLACEVELPELRTCRQAAPEVGEAAEVTIRYGRVEPSVDGGWVTVVEPGDVQLAIPTVARFRVRSGASVCIDPAPGADPDVVRLYLLGSVLGVLCHQRGLLPLHANAVVSDGVAFAFAGPSGAGKSTLAAHFATAGRPVLCDDLCVVHSKPAPAVATGLPRLKLWSETLSGLRLEASGVRRLAEGLPKFDMPIAPAMTSSDPTPLAAIYVLSDTPGEGNAAQITDLSRVDALAQIMANVYRVELLSALKATSDVFGRVSRIVAEVPVFRYARRRGFDVFAQECALLEDHMSTMAGRRAR